MLFTILKLVIISHLHLTYSLWISNPYITDKCSIRRTIQNMRSYASSSDTKSQPPFEAYQEAPAVNDQVKFKHSRLDKSVMIDRARDFHQLMNLRRSVRFFSKDSFPEEVILKCIETAGTAPSGAHQQPWHFAIVKDISLKKKIREIVEREEQQNYDGRMKKSWVQDVAPLLNNTILYDKGVISKPYLEEAPYLVVAFELTHGVDNDGKRFDHYYVKQSIGCAVGLFMAALTNVGLFTLLSTPLHAEAEIRDLLNRPANERLYMLMPVGFPADDATVPYRSDETVPLRKSLSDICSHH